MPLYEYQCDACGHRFEAIRKFSDAPLDRCPKCEGAVHKLQSAPAFQFKGTGWYVTDYARKDKPASKTEGGSREGRSDGKDASSAEKTDKTEKAEKTDKTDKTDTTGKAEKTDKADKTAPAVSTPRSTTDTT